MASCDYDGRTALHLAAAEGQLDALEFLLRTCAVPPEPVDRYRRVFALDVRIMHWHQLSFEEGAEFKCRLLRIDQCSVLTPDPISGPGSVILLQI
jgi:ankyrin repeat protein